MAALAASLTLAVALPRAQAQTFKMTVIDPNQAGDCKAAGDLDNDGFPDLVVGGMPNEKLTWYHNPDWAKTVIATARNQFTTDCAIGDVDGDGDLDFVVPDGPDGVNLVWFENPLVKGSTTRVGNWKRHDIGAIGNWGKDVELADFDHDGRLDVATRGPDKAMIFFQTAPNVWTRVDLPGVPLGEEGMASGDIDGDGYVDLVVFGAWVRNPGKDLAKDGKSWKAYTIGSVSPAFKADVADIDGDGKMDVVFSSSEHTADVVWFGAVNGDPTGRWVGHVVFPQLERGHTLQVADINGDGHNDIFAGQMHTSRDKRVMYALNLDGKGLAWQRKVIGRTGLHDGVAVDVNKDGLPDLFGANWTGNPPVHLWQQVAPTKTRALSTDFWTTIAVTRNHERTFGLGFGDVNGDGRADIVSGAYVYLNPGGDLSGDWTQMALPDGMQAFGTMRVVDRPLADVIAQRHAGDKIELYWLAPTDNTLKSWTSHKIGTVPKASHDLGAQGYRIADIVPGSKPEVAISSGDGIYFFEVPAHPATDPWRRTHVSNHPSDEGFAVMDIDGDGLPDIAATTGESKHVEWYRNPGKPGAAWTAHRAGEMQESVYPDRVALADLNGDGLPDIIATEENGKASGAKTYWWEHPKSLDGDPAWTRHLLTTQATTHGLDVADINRDGTLDLITGEHRGDKRTILWLNDGHGHFTPKEIARGLESHMGSRFYDLDGDGDLDVVTIAWDHPELIWIARNDVITRTPFVNNKDHLIASVTSTPDPSRWDNFLEHFRWASLRAHLHGLVRRLTN